MNKIEELKEKLEKDPASKLFVPLAEEYRKAGMFDEAVGVLLAGIERQPKYTSAVVALGKIYFEKGMYAESKAEFEKVVAAVPDNLLAHRKLADIHKELGERDEAIEKYKKVLKLNPMDEEAQGILAKLASAPAAPPPTEEVLEAEEAVAEAEPFEEAVEAVEMAEEDEEGLFALSDEEMAQAEEEFAEVDLTELEVVEAVEEAVAVEFPSEEAVDEVFSAEEAAEEGEEEVFALSDEEVFEAEGEFEEAGEILTPVDAEEEALGEETLEVVEEAVEDEMDEELPSEEAVEAAVDEVFSAEEAAEEGEEEVFALSNEAVAEAEGEFEEVGETLTPVYAEEEALGEEVLEAVGEAEPAEEVLEAVEEAATLDEAGFQDIDAVEVEEEAPEVQVAEAGPELQRAEGYVAEGEYAKALNIYREVLSREPGNQKAQQHLKELQSLVAILGKHEEMLVAKLEAFLEAIRKRRDEFFRNA
jgi:tetratricopeptide (TPR) repeat protein